MCPDGSCYEGEWKDGKHNGQGKATSPDGSICYEGELKDGKENGQGKLTYPNGSCYEGEWKDGNPTGTGKVTFPDGTVIHIKNFKRVFPGLSKKKQKNKRRASGA